MNEPQIRQRWLMCKITGQMSLVVEVIQIDPIKYVVLQTGIPSETFFGLEHREIIVGDIITYEGYNFDSNYWEYLSGQNAPKEAS